MKLLPQTAKLTTEPPEPGIYPGVPTSVYFSWRATSASLLKVISTDTPMHAMATMRGERDDDSAARKFGRAIHTFILEPRRFAAETLIVPRMQLNDKGEPTATKRDPRHARYRALLDKVGGDEDRIIFDDEIGDMKAMRDRLYTDDFRRKLCEKPGQAELSIVWDDAETGLRCKARIDKLYTVPSVANVIVDYKSTCSAAYGDFSKDIATYGYDLAAAMYTDGVRAIVNDLPSEFYLLAQEKASPFAPALFRLDHDSVQHGSVGTSVDVGRYYVRKAMRTLAECIQADNWPGYATGAVVPTLPMWRIPSDSVVGA